MRLLKTATFVGLATIVGSSIALGQAPNPKTSTAPPPAAATSDKAAISKTCSDLANQQGLHGKKRKQFRAECKKNGGQAPQ